MNRLERKEVFGMTEEENRLASDLHSEAMKMQFDTTSSSSPPQLLDAGNQAPLRNWSAHLLEDGRVLVHILRPPKSSTLKEEDPFGDRWDLEIANFLLEFYLKLDMRVQEFFSAQRISYDDAFAYHICFQAVEKRTGETCNIFGEVEISRSSPSVFVPRVYFCEIIDLARDYERGCLFCEPWVPHPKGGMKTIREDASVRGILRPHVSYIPAQEQRDPSEGFSRGKKVSNKEFKALLMEEGVVIPPQLLEKLKDDE